ncbi:MULTISPECIES: TetR/AcrR family transcriptional regulator [Rhizobium]|uniref:TetR/AcrR family transcriptional regulator n=1 Tax=Rhizobium TaxID=379 RepID=UPI001B344B25|nr:MULTISPECIES: TetR/AcrR family transcriptional regulator [Rhizobium]MBX4907418.1 TetR/AcrR family transcriptional regulator [Rhizobium bangladeshense]MBX5227175.1 TetR/AcrR family transcriptional regulator [Rhizobium sp. NLR9b]MBX5232345.1 TetR/AcrR family transcriptional regulator [Rhizobium sp. NLR4a]MBX5238480.1 TetR/AcrR family transcriptional regulator [Rhizobium sp. NLR22b]MBX5249960.1 TetR/AcrR family transcriptional regulator [Rhizobium sp. NLR4b]
MIETKRNNDPEGVRRRIIDAAYDAFVTQGYLATGMLELRERASVSGGALAHHFPAKRDLGLAVIRDRVAAAVRQTWIEPLRTCADAPTAIDLIFEAIIGELTQKDRVSGCPLNNMAMEVSQHDAEMRALVSAVFGDWHKALFAKFAADLEEKRAIGLHPRTIATLVIAAYSGAMTMAKASQDVGPLRDCRAELATLLAANYRRP